MNSQISKGGAYKQFILFTSKVLESRLVILGHLTGLKQNKAHGHVSTMLPLNILPKHLFHLDMNISLTVIWLFTVV